MRFIFNISLYTPEKGFDCFSSVIYAKDRISAFNKVFRELGDLKSCLLTISLDICESESFHDHKFKRM